MGLAVNDIIQVTAEGRMFSQRILWVMHYRCTVPASTGSNHETIMALLEYLWGIDVGTLSVPMLNASSFNFTLLSARGQKVAPVREAYAELQLIDAGEINIEWEGTANLAWVIIKQTARAGRRGHGAVHFHMPSNNWYNAGALQAEGGPERKVLADKIPEVAIVPAGGQFEPVIYHKGFSPNYDRITHCTIKSEVRTMSRRTVGRGV